MENYVEIDVQFSKFSTFNSMKVEKLEKEVKVKRWRELKMLKEALTFEEIRFRLVA